MGLSRTWRSSEMVARSRVPLVLSELLGVPPGQLRLKVQGAEAGVDFVVTTKTHTWLVDVVGRPTPQTLSSHWARVRARANGRIIPTLAVPFMSQGSQAWCSEHDINWLDFSGNARVRAPGLYVHVVGRPNAYAKRGRPSSVFERRSSRVARALLQHPGRVWSVADCARTTGLDDGHVSRIVARLVEDQLLGRDEQRRFHVRDAGALLDAWRESADFSKHQILRGHIAARSGAELLQVVSQRLADQNISHAATGLGAAWLYDRFAMFRLVTLYVREWPTPAQLDSLHFREDRSGPNTWLVLPNDDGVFDGERTIDGVPCVHPTQVYVDLSDQPERASEASAHLRGNPALIGLSDAAPKA